MSQAPDRDLTPLQRAAFVVKQMRARVDALEREKAEPIAIVGIGCRLPGGADTPERYWRLLSGGIDATRVVPPERWDADAYYDPDPDAVWKMSTRQGGFLSERIDLFDAEFFGLTPREAMTMDPQQRLLLEVAWESLEDAGIAADRLAGSATGIYVGFITADYSRIPFQILDPDDLPYMGMGNDLSFAAGRLSYLLGLQGPCMVVATACSSTLVSTHLACQALRARECDLALSGGVSLMVFPDNSIVLSRMRATAPDGRSKAFDASADGFGRGEGSAVVVLKRLSDAMRDGDRIRAVIRGSAINHGGATGGITVPNGPAQELVVRRALAAAGVDADRVDYVETHGTGTPLGDPIELQALEAVFGTGGRAHPLHIASVKTNIGHLEAAAGVASMAKVALAIEHEQIPPHLHFRTPNPRLPWGEMHLAVPTSLTPWLRSDRPRIAGISSFGLSGINAHLIMEEPPARPDPQPAGAPTGPQVLALSARTDVAVAALIERYIGYLEACPASIAFADICFSANTGRACFAHRLAVVASSPAEALERLRAAHAGASSRGVFRGVVRDGGRAPGFEPGEDDSAEARAARFVRGVPVDWERVYGGAAHAKVPLPTYPFQRQRYWVDVSLDDVERAAHRASGASTASDHPLLGRRIRSAAKEIQFESDVSAASPPFLADHRVYGDVVVPGAAYVEMALAAAVALHPASRPVVYDIAFHHVLHLPAGQTRTLQTVCTPSGPGSFTFEVASLGEDGDTWVLHASGRAGADESDAPTPEDVRALEARCRSTVDVGAFYSEIARRGIEYGPAFRTIDTLAANDAESCGRFRVPPAIAAAADRWRLHPAILDAALQVLGASAPTGGDDAAYVPVGIGRVRCYGPLTASPVVHGVFGRGQSWDAPVTSASVRVLDGDGRVIADVDDVRFQKVSRQALFGAAFKSWLYEIEWRPAERSEAARPRTAGRWLVLGGAALGVRVAAAVTARGAACATDASVLDDGEPLAGVLDLRALDVPNAVPPLDAAADSCARVLSLVQTLARGARRSPPRLWIATRGATAAPPHAGLPGLADATLWGMGRAVALEHPELRCSLIDLDPAGDGLDVDGLLDAVLADAAEPAVALRGADRLVARLARSAAAPADGDARFRGDSTYLVTGGLTGLGLEVADWMAGLGAGRLVLVGRRAPDAAARARIARMSARGAQVIVRQADAADRDQLTQVLAEIDASAAPLAGVFHLAGVFDDGIAIQQTRERFERVLRPKVQGGWLLHELTIDRPLDHFVLFSSAVSILGNAGQSNYAAANAFLDALATHRRARGLAALSLDWGPWAEIGAAAELVPRTGGPGARAMRALRPAEGLQVLGQILSAPAPQIAILPIEWPALDAAAAPPLLADFARQVPAREMRDAFVNDRWAAAPPALRRELLVGHVCALACAVMGLPAGTTIDPDEGFFDLGFDSLMSVQLRNRLQTSLGCSLSATLAFDHPTPAALADYLLLDALRPAADAVDAAPAGVGDDELRAVLDGVEQLSDEEALAALRQQGRAW